MARDLEPASGKSVGASLGTKAIAVVVLLVAAYVLFVVLKGIVLALAVPVVVILALVGLWWAWRTLR
jgi:hypothetical protein